MTSTNFYLIWTLIILMQVFRLSMQNLRDGSWHRMVGSAGGGPWRLPHFMFDNNRMDNEMEDCQNQPNKCSSNRYESGNSREYPVSAYDSAASNSDLLENIDVKRYSTKKFANDGSDMFIAPSSMSNVDDAGKNNIFFKSSRLPTCACDVRYELRDLHATGHKYYPRYVPSAVCTAELCWSTLYKCRPKFYKMYFLKRRSDADSSGGSSSDDSMMIDRGVHGPLTPDTLRKDWTFEPMNIAVACECSP